MRRRAEKELQVTRAKIAELGVDPDTVGVPAKLPPEAPPPTLDELPDEVERLNKMMVELRADAEKKGEEALKRMREMMKEAGFDPDAAAARGKREGAGPPKFRARAEMDRARATIAEGRAAGLDMSKIEGSLLDPKYEAKLHEVERRLREMYRTAAHHQDAAARLVGDEAARAREEILTAVARGESLVDRDFTGVNLAGADLVGADLRGAFLENADLTGANLQGADLTGAVLARGECARWLHSTPTGAMTGDDRLAAVALPVGAGTTLVRIDLDRGAVHVLDVPDSRMSRGVIAGSVIPTAFIPVLEPRMSRGAGAARAGWKLLLMSLEMLRTQGAVAPR
jgi:hypothetical protein